MTKNLDPESGTFIIWKFHAVAERWTGYDWRDTEVFYIRECSEGTNGFMLCRHNGIQEIVSTLGHCKRFANQLARLRDARAINIPTGKPAVGRFK